MINVGIYGDSNLGKSVERELLKSKNMKLAAIFTKQDPKTIVPISKKVDVISMDDIERYRWLDVMLLCGGSSKHLTAEGAKIARMFNTVHCFNMHRGKEKYLKIADDACRYAGNVSIILTDCNTEISSVTRDDAEANVLVTCAKVAYRMWYAGEYGARKATDVIEF